jgi:hypothetical protein
MYTLRIIEETRPDTGSMFNQVIENHELGSSYSKLEKGKTKEFTRIMGELFPKESPEEVESLICAENEKVFFIMERTQLRENTYFIMSDNGKTFEKL